MGEKDDEFIEALISQVSLHDVIFNKRNGDHHRTQCVEAAWEEIAKAINKEPKWCVEKWKNLYRNYRNFLNKENLPSGSGASSRGRPKFGYAHQMSFLLEHIQPKETTSNWKRNDNSQESFAGSHSSGGAYPGGSQSSKSFRGLSQHNEGSDDWDDNMNLVQSGFEEPDPNQLYAPLLEDETNSSENRKRAAVDYDPEDLDDVVLCEEVEPSGDQNRARSKRDRSKKSKPSKPKAQKRLTPTDQFPNENDLEGNFYQQMTAAAGTITSCFQQNPKPKEKPSDEEAIISHFCKMQKYMLKTINSAARMEYIKECTDKLTQLCQRESHII